jgi:hypothetical protein
MTRADWQAATPKCPGRPTHAGLSLCGRPLEWTTEPVADVWAALFHSDGDGLWCCPRHGPMLSGLEAAERTAA